MSDQIIRAYQQLEGSILQYQFDFSPWLAARNLEADTAVAEVIRGAAFVGIVDQRLQAGLWIADIEARAVGEATLEVTMIPESGNLRRKRRFVITVTDPIA